MRYRVEARPSPDYDKKQHMRPSWIVLLFRDGRLASAKRFDGQEPRRDAERYAKLLRETIRTKRVAK